MAGRGGELAGTCLATALEALCIDVDEGVLANDAVHHKVEQRDGRDEGRDDAEGEPQEQGHDVVRDLVAVVDVLVLPQPRLGALRAAAQGADPVHDQLCTAQESLTCVSDPNREACCHCVLCGAAELHRQRQYITTPDIRPCISYQATGHLRSDLQTLSHVCSSGAHGCKEALLLRARLALLKKLTQERVLCQCK